MFPEKLELMPRMLTNKCDQKNVPSLLLINARVYHSEDQILICFNWPPTSAWPMVVHFWYKLGLSSGTSCIAMHR